MAVTFMSSDLVKSLCRAARTSLPVSAPGSAPREEAEDMQAFVELFLVYAFDLPTKIANRKAAHTAPT